MEQNQKQATIQQQREGKQIRIQTNVQRRPRPATSKLLYVPGQDQPKRSQSRNSNKSQANSRDRASVTAPDYKQNLSMKNSRSNSNQMFGGTQNFNARKGSRDIDLNNPSLRDWARREQQKTLNLAETQQIRAQGSQRKHRVIDHQVFETQKRQSSTGQGLMGLHSPEVVSSDDGSLKRTGGRKQLNYMNFSRAECDPISSKKRSQVYSEYNKHVYLYEDNRKVSLQQAKDEEKRVVAASKGLGGPKGLAEWQKRMQHHIQRLKEGEITVQEYERMAAQKPRPISVIRQNIKNVTSMSRANSFNQESQSTQTRQGQGILSGNRANFAYNNEAMMEQIMVSSGRGRDERLEDAKYITKLDLNEKKQLNQEAIIDIVSSRTNALKEKLNIQLEVQVPGARDHERKSFKNFNDFIEAYDKQSIDQQKDSETKPVIAAFSRPRPKTGVSRTQQRFNETFATLNKQQNMYVQSIAPSHQRTSSAPRSRMQPAQNYATLQSRRHQSVSRGLQDQPSDHKHATSAAFRRNFIRPQTANMVQSRRAGAATPTSPSGGRQLVFQSRSKAQIVEQPKESKESRQGTGGAGNRFNEHDLNDFYSTEPINKAQNKPFVFKRREDGKVSMMTYLIQPMGSQCNKPQNTLDHAASGHEDSKSRQSLLERRKEVIKRRQSETGRSRSVGRQRPQTSTVQSPSAVKSPKSPKSVVKQLMSEADQKFAEYQKNMKLEKKTLSTIRSEIPEELLNVAVDDAIRGLVIKEKIGEIDQYISTKINQDNSRSNTNTPGGPTSNGNKSENHDKMLQYAIDCIQRLRDRRKSTLSDSNAREGPSQRQPSPTKKRLASTSQSKYKTSQLNSTEKQSRKSSLTSQRPAPPKPVKQTQKVTSVSPIRHQTNPLSQDKEIISLNVNTLPHPSNGDYASEPVEQKVKRDNSSAGSVHKVKELVQKDQEDQRQEEIVAMTKKRRAITINRPVIPHLHLVNLRREESLINKVLFHEKKTPQAQTKTILVEEQVPVKRKELIMRQRSVTQPRDRPATGDPQRQQAKSIGRQKELSAADKAEILRKRREVRLLKKAVATEKQRSNVSNIYGQQGVGQKAQTILDRLKEKLKQRNA